MDDDRSTSRSRMARCGGGRRTLIDSSLSLACATRPSLLQDGIRLRLDQVLVLALNFRRDFVKYDLAGGTHLLVSWLVHNITLLQNFNNCALEYYTYSMAKVVTTNLVTRVHMELSNSQPRHATPLHEPQNGKHKYCLLYTSDAADE